jgi:MMP 1-O-methyltransferase
MNIYEKIKNIEGWLTPGEANLLYSLAKKTKGKGRIVEIGSWKGRSTVCLASGAKETGVGKVVAIDPHLGSSEHQRQDPTINTLAEFKNNIAAAGLTEAVDLEVMTSAAAAAAFAEPVELCFIDGAHEYEFVKEDYDLWFPKIVDGGVIAFHDTIRWPGPKKVVAENIFQSKKISHAGFIDSISYGTKVAENNSFDRLRNRYILCLKDSFEQFRQIKKRFKFLGFLTPLIRRIFKSIQ